MHDLTQVLVQQVAMEAATLGETDGLRPGSGSEGGFVCFDPLVFRLIQWLDFC